MEIQSKTMRSRGGKGEVKPVMTARGRTIEEDDDEGEPLSPLSRVFLDPELDCHILCVMGSGNTMDVDVMKAGLANTLLRHPRFSSRQIRDGRGGGRWVPTEVELDRHVICPEVDPASDPSLFVSNYLTRLSTTPLDLSRPLWDLHILNVPTTSSSAVAVLRLHHSLGDGSSLVSLLLACTRKTSDPSSVPTVPGPRQIDRAGRRGFRWLLELLLLFWNTAVDAVTLLATALWLRDSDTPLKGKEGVEARAKRFVHRDVGMEDVKAAREATGATVNDVLLGMTSAGIVRYLKRKSASNASDKCCVGSNIRLRSTVLVNVRKSPEIRDLYDMMEGAKTKTDWGNRFGYLILPFSIVEYGNPLDHVKAAMVVSKRKKSSLGALFSFYSGLVMFKLFGVKFAETVSHRVLSNTTISFSNVIGPLEEVSFYGNPVRYIAPTVYGHPQALTIHYMSYMGKVEIVLAVDESVIPDADQLLDDFVQSLYLIKDAATISRQ